MQGVSDAKCLAKGRYIAFSRVREHDIEDLQRCELWDADHVDILVSLIKPADVSRMAEHVICPRCHCLLTSPHCCAEVHGAVQGPP